MNNDKIKNVFIPGIPCAAPEIPPVELLDRRKEDQEQSHELQWRRANRTNDRVLETRRNQSHSKRRRRLRLFQ